MTENERDEIIAASWAAHSLVEESYVADSSVKGDPQWLEKQRLLLADMALHLLQTALGPGDIDEEKLKNNIYSILTIADNFLPEAKLAQAREDIF